MAVYRSIMHRKRIDVVCLSWVIFALLVVSIYNTRWLCVGNVETIGLWEHCKELHCASLLGYLWDKSVVSLEYCRHFNCHRIHLADGQSEILNARIFAVTAICLVVAGGFISMMRAFQQHDSYGKVVAGCFSCAGLFMIGTLLNFTVLARKLQMETPNEFVYRNITYEWCYVLGWFLTFVLFVSAICLCIE